MNSEHDKIVHPDQEEPLDQTYGWGFHKVLILIALGLTLVFYLVVYQLAHL